MDDADASDSAHVARVKAVEVLPALLAVQVLPRPNAHNADLMRERLAAPPMSRASLNKLPAVFAHVMAALHLESFDDKGLHMVVQFQAAA